MFQFLLLVVLASVPASSFSTNLPPLPLILHDARLGDIAGLCKLFCEDHDYEDFFFKSVESVIQPRIFCGICKKKLSTSTTPQTSTTPSTSTTTTTTTTTTTSPPTSSSTFSSTSQPTTTEPTAAPTTEPAPTTA